MIHFLSRSVLSVFPLNRGTRSLRFVHLFWCVVLLTGVLKVASAAVYDPLQVSTSEPVKTVDLTVHDAGRDRDIPLLVYLPASTKPAPVILFSHGLGGSRKNNAYLGKHWSGRGYAVVFVQHPGSDESVWREAALLQRLSAMKKAASGQNYLLRVKDIPAVLGQLEQWNKTPDHALHQRLDLQHVGMSGHSFGAVTTQAVSGQAAPLVGQRFTDVRIDAALALSPSSPERFDSAVSFGSVKIPWMLMTGTHDVSIINDTTVASRLDVYPHLPNTIDRYELVLHNAEHSAFSERSLPGDRQHRNPNHHRAILALSTAFWDTYLRNDPAARQWLQGPESSKLLEAQDRWQHKVAGE